MNKIILEQAPGTSVAIVMLSKILFTAFNFSKKDEWRGGYLYDEAHSALCFSSEEFFQSAAICRLNNAFFLQQMLSPRIKLKGP